MSGTPSLNKALSQLQGELPKITKGQKAKIDGKEGKRGYEYSYADLTDVTAAVAPLLAKYGLAFHCAPVRDPDDRREMILSWSLLHESGEERSGEWPLGAANTPPQTLGGRITYARRYCLGAATGIVAEEDDDGQRAQHDHSRQSAADAFENATPAPPRQNRNGHTSRPAPPEPPAAQEPDEISEDAQAFAEEAYTALTAAAINDIHAKAREKGVVTALIRNPSSGGTGKLAVYLDWRRKQLKEAEAELSELTAVAKDTGFPAEELETHVKAVTGTDLDAANAAQLRQATLALRNMQGATA